MDEFFKFEKIVNGFKKISFISNLDNTEYKFEWDSAANKNTYKNIYELLEIHIPRFKKLNLTTIYLVLLFKRFEDNIDDEQADDVLFEMMSIYEDTNLKKSEDNEAYVKYYFEIEKYYLFLQKLNIYDNIILSL